MAFGKKYEYNPVPDKVGMLLVAYANAGKSTLAARMVPPGKTGVVIDSDGRFDEVVTDDVEFVRLSDEQSEMSDPKQVYDIMHASMPNDEIGLALVDSVTAILEPIILGIQRDVDENKSSGARGYKKKADAMKFLQAAFAPWGIDTIWVYHYRDFGDAFGKEKTGTSITELELARLYRNINIQCEIVVDKNERRGLKILFARGGRTGFTIWDDSGSWEGIRERLLQEVWGGLTREEQTKLVEDGPTGFSSSSEAIAWAVDLGAFDEVEGHAGQTSKAKNSFKKLYRELKAELGDELTQDVAFAAWVDKVTKKISAE